MQVVGVDGCPGGWIALAWTSGDVAFSHAIAPNVRDILAAFPEASAIAIDIPIGLKGCAPRQCDSLVRKLLGPRGPSVFPAPHAELCCEPGYRIANARSRDLCGRGISAQAHGIYPRVCDANSVITEDQQARIIEIHPELSFWAMGGRKPCAFSKRTPPGFSERLALLSQNLGLDIPDWGTLRNWFRPAKPDDVLDALAALWTAKRHALGIAERIPESPELGLNGLRMEMVY